ncbi:hypothetical protein DRJ48_02750 [Candidatus Woesearchaeota archaeon]|nr:MAG: hypothetical protein DRJ48_02750 [Candidatus Woesearchaeota archaeon]
MKSIVVSDFDESILEECCTNLSNQDSVEVWSPYEVALLGIIAPTAVQRINQHTGEEYPYHIENVQKEALSLVSLLVTTIDNSVFKGVISPEMVASKAKAMERLYSVLGEKPPFHHTNINSTNFLKKAFMIKQMAIEIGAGLAPRQDATQCLEEALDYQSFASYFSNMYQDNLIGIIRYIPELFKPRPGFNLVILLKEFTFKDYKRLLNAKFKIPLPTPIHLMLLPTEHLQAFASYSSVGYLIIRTGESMFASVDEFPVVKEDDYIDSVYFELPRAMTTLRGSVSSPNKINWVVNNSPLFFHTYSQRFVVSHGLLQVEQQRFIPKDVFFSHLDGAKVLPSNMSSDEKMRLLLEANVRMMKRIKEHMEIIATEPYISSKYCASLYAQ